MPEPAKTLIVAQERTRRTFLVFVFSRPNKTILRVILTRGTMPRYLRNIRRRKVSAAHSSNTKILSAAALDLVKLFHFL